MASVTTRAAALAALASCFTLSACGGDGGSGIASTPPPTYTKVADMTGDRTFQTAGIKYTVGPNVNFTNPQSQAFGSGAQVRYTAASDTYTLTDGSSTASFDPSNLVTNPVPPAGTVRWQKVNGSTLEAFSLTVPSVNGVPLSYVVTGSWLTVNTTTNIGTNRLAYGGAPTQTSDMPRSGSATYNSSIGGALAQGASNFSLTGNSTATFSANFAANTVATSISLAGTPTLPLGGPVSSFGTYTGSGTISANGISGTLSGGSMTGGFSGAFFGPQALEYGAGWYLNGSIGGTPTNAVGSIFGIKQ